MWTNYELTTSYGQPMPTTVGTDCPERSVPLETTRATKSVEPDGTDPTAVGTDLGRRYIPPLESV
jgi:hypothetical protein